MKRRLFNKVLEAIILSFVGLSLVGLGNAKAQGPAQAPPQDPAGQPAGPEPGVARISLI